jgi:small subunit ribosomal protein S6
MREYEVIFIVRPDLDESAFGEVINRVKAWITDGGGEVKKVDQWGKKKLAYPVRKQIEGQYVLMNVAIAPQFSSQLERNLRFLEPVIRFFIAVKN